MDQLDSHISAKLADFTFVFQAWKAARKLAAEGDEGYAFIDLCSGIKEVLVDMAKDLNRVLH